jgi:uncharacterized glyoxalase superfamily protein PhnB
MSEQHFLPAGASCVSPYITVLDVDKSVNFYKKAFNFQVKELAPGEDGTTWHAELLYKDQLIMLGKQGAYNATSESPLASGIESPISLYLYCEDVDAFYERAMKEGAQSVDAPENMFWGDRMCRLKDLDNYIWCFATHSSKT